MSNCFPPVALLISSYNRPRHLALALTSIEHQRHDPAGMEVVITDDGSDSDTLAVVADYAARAKWAVKLTTHSHAAFQLARCRNEGVLASRAPYLLFLDGDCILPPDHVAQHLRRRRSGMVMAGDCCRLGANISRQIDDVAIRDGQFLEWESRAERRRLRNQYRKSLMYNLLHHPTKPKLTGNNIGIWRQDYEQINGFDEHYEGWGCEDNDLQVRLRRVGIRVASILKWTHSYHLWHPPALSCPGRWHDGTNVTYLENARYRPVRCNHGLQYFCCQPDRMVAKSTVWRTGLLRNVARSLTSGVGPCSPHVEAPKDALGSTAARRTI
ncbi:MAG: glycosyltransferase, partial [Pirellulales bacterium]|nr:glycosyltransferase [Pirellulales bacterium]